MKETNISNGAYIDSREVAELIEKKHRDLLKIIRKNISYLIESNFAPNDFFLENTYFDNIGRTLPCFLLSKMGCELIANKLTGKKGILFTAAYVKRFNELEFYERAELAYLAADSQRRENQLDEISAFTKIVTGAMKALGATPEQLMDFYSQLGLIESEADDNTSNRWYNATAIAKLCGLYSMNFNPHKQAVACILNENIFISDEHKRTEIGFFGGRLGARVQYDDYAALEVMQWLVDNECPDEVYGFKRTYYLEYEDDYEQ